MLLLLWRALKSHCLSYLDSPGEREGPEVVAQNLLHLQGLSELVPKFLPSDLRAWTGESCHGEDDKVTATCPLGIRNCYQNSGETPLSLTHTCPHIHTCVFIHVYTWHMHTQWKPQGSPLNWDENLTDQAWWGTPYTHTPNSSEQHTFLNHMSTQSQLTSKRDTWLCFPPQKYNKYSSDTLNTINKYPNPICIKDIERKHIFHNHVIHYFE